MNICKLKLIFRSAVKTLGELRHSGLLDVYQFIETDTSLTIITERVSKLAFLPIYEPDSGLIQICSAYSFLHNEAKLNHKINLGSVCVSKNGDWKLFVFEQIDSPFHFKPSEVMLLCYIMS